MPCGTLLQTGSYSMTSTRDAERHPYFFYSKTLVNTEKMLESTDFACTLKETKTTIPISRTPKPISGFGLKPGRYRPSAVKVAGFDPLDANHAASAGGVASRPRQDVQTRKGKHWNERQPNDTAHANDRDGNGLRDREHAGRPGTGPIRNGERRSRFTIHRINTGDGNHVHMLVSIPPDMTISGTVSRIKQLSTHELWGKHPDHLRHYYWGKHHRLWSGGYYCETVGRNSESVVERYIDGQQQAEAIHPRH